MHRGLRRWKRVSRRIAPRAIRLLGGLLALAAMQCSYGQTLPYAEGGPATGDPGAGLAPELRRYIDAEAGDDASDGRSPATAWQSLARVTQAKGALRPGAHVLFRRGQRWRGAVDVTEVHGAEGSRIVLGAYGLPLSSRPMIEGTVNGSTSSHLMIRDFDCIKIDASAGAQHVLIFDNVVHGSPELDEWPSNGIRVFGASDHIAIVQNLVYDLKANDCIVVHPDGGGIGARDSHWILDNVCIGNSGMEDGVDLAMSEPEHGTDEHISGDVKVVCNRIQMKALAGTSARAGRGSKCFSAGHEGRYIWVVGNIMGGSEHIGMKLGTEKRYFQIAGNVMFNCANNNSKVTGELLAQELRTEHNTFIHTMENRAVLKIGGANHRFLDNLVIRVRPGGALAEMPPGEAGPAVVEMDRNWYGYVSDPVLGATPWAQWRKAGGFDAASRAGPVPGVTAPEENALTDDPRNWRDAAFLKHFVPDATWAGCRGADTPGAFDSEGDQLGLLIRPLPGLDNDGYGWMGPPLVQQRLKELGVKLAPRELTTGA